jgi:hypothetical protein
MQFWQQAQVIRGKLMQVQENLAQQILAILTLCLDPNKVLEIIHQDYNVQVVELHLRFFNQEPLSNHSKFWIMEAK